MNTIKNFFFLSVMILFNTEQIYSQASNCFDSYLSPFCSGIAQYPANYDGTGSGSGPQAPAGPNYDCLGTMGNPTYFSLTIEQTGSINFTLDNTANVDIDFILWGPFTDIAAAGLACDSMGQGGQWGVVDTCSYSAISQEPVTVSNAQAGEVYILMVTNYTNVATSIFSTQNSGSGNIACPCDIPYTIDTMPALAGNQGYLTDTSNGINQFVICPNNLLGIQVGAKANINDTLNIYAPFTSINSGFFVNNTIFTVHPNAPSFDSLEIYATITPQNSEIGVNNFTLGIQNDIYTGGLTDSSCFDQISIQVIVPGVNLQDKTICSGESVLLSADSIPSTSIGSSTYSWVQISGPTVNLSSTTGREITVNIPVSSSTSSNDSIEIEVDYIYGTECGMKDTVVLYFQDVNLLLNVNPDTICVGQSAILTASISDTLNPPVCNDYDVLTIPFLPVSGTGTTLSLGDDQLSSSLPVGFNFNFYCNGYTNFYISSNGFITFDPSSGNGCCAGQNLPDPLAPNDLIAMCWTDCNPTAGGTIEYFTVGTAPNRQLIVNFINIPPFSTSSGNQTVQAILYEGTDIIELHVTNATPSGSFNSLTLGIENASGSIGHAGPGTNGATNTISNVAFRFSPKNYGPFYAWSPSGGLSATDADSILASPSITSTYTVAVTDGVCLYSDSTTIHTISTLSTPVVSCDSNTINSISFSWSDLGLPGTGFYEYSTDGGVSWINAGATFSATVSGLNSNTAYPVMVRANDGSGGSCPLSQSGLDTCSTTGINCPGVNIVLNGINLNCNNDSSGCVTSTISGGFGTPLLFNWSNGQSGMDSICNLQAGSYTLYVSDTISSGSASAVNTTVYTEDFDGVHNWTLNVATGTNGADNNFWEVDSDEAGMPVGSCGTSGGSNRSLHITSVFFPGGGAAYDAGGLCPILFCPETNMRSESPVFSTVGLTNLMFEFNYIANGNGLIDNASVVFNDGSGWQVLDASIKSTVCGSGQGLWTKFTMSLPVSCENNTTVQVGLNWENNDDGIGTDPSVAIDSVLVFSTGASSSLITCIDSQSITITEPSPIVLNVDSSSNPACTNSGDGTVSISVTGGTGSYNFIWNNSSTTEDLSGLNSGSYIVTVTDQNNCTDTTEVILAAPNGITLSLADTTNIGCNDAPNTGAIDVLSGGGSGILNFLWSNSATTEDISGLSAGDYTLTLSDASNCSNIMTFTVEEDTSVTVSISPLTANLSCDLLPEGALLATATGGSGLTYTWSNNTTDANATGLSAGNYTVTATNNNGCTDTISGNILAPAVPTINAYVSVTGTTSITIQLGNSVFLSSGSTGYNYNWTSIVDPVTGNSNITNPTQDTTTANPEPQGVYTYIVTASLTTNDTICYDTDTVTVIVEAPYQGIPDAFSPNGDNSNDYFKPIGLSDTEIKSLRVFNRWGQEVFNGDDSIGNGWDGTYLGAEQPTDVYLYLLIYQKLSDTEPTTLRGEVTLLR